MCQMNKLKKAILICTTIGVINIVLCLIQYAVYYYSNPMEEKVDFKTTGCLIFDPDDSEMESVSVEVYGKKLHYIYGNEPDAIQGDIYINGTNIFGHDRQRNSEGFGFYTEFHEQDFATVEIQGEDLDCNMISVSKDFQTIICSVDISQDISKNGKTGVKGQALLLVPKMDLESARENIQNASQNTEQLKNWLDNNGWKLN